MNLTESLGFKSEPNAKPVNKRRIHQYINLKLSALGQPVFNTPQDGKFLEIARPLFSDHQARNRMLGSYLCPADRRIQDFLAAYLSDTGEPIPELPAETFILDRHGLARTMSLPPDKDSFVSDIIASYRVKQGVLHNPHKDRRTTQGVFHVAEGGLPIPGDKRAVPKITFLRLLTEALSPPSSLLQLPFTSTQEKQAELFVSLLLRPTVCPEIPNISPAKSMEIRYFAPGSMVSNLDFVESIFGNAGNPYLPENDAGLDVAHWTGHTGCVILAPHLIYVKKKDVGLPHYDQATEQQRRDGMCWKNADELYNDGGAFKITCRDERGIMVTIISDNYFGYCKKEVKTQISYSSNLYGLSEEEHAGGAMAFPSYDLGESFHLDERLPQNGSTFVEVAQHYAALMELQPEGYGIDKRYRNILYLPEDARLDVNTQRITWNKAGADQAIQLLPNHTYVLPSGYKLRMAKQLGGTNWRLFGTTAEGTLCHKPCTVSGGGKSEISKSISDAMVQGPVYVADLHRDIATVEKIFQYDFSKRFRVPHENPRPSRPVLSPHRSLGSVIKLFTPSNEYTDEYNRWLDSIPQQVKDLIYVVRRYYRQEWGENWREHFTVDMINGHLGHELKYNNKRLIAHYLRVGREIDGSWRLYKLRSDYSAADKIQFEDDITVSQVVPAAKLRHLNAEQNNLSVKIVRNCEYRLFQRPDDAVIHGYDKQAEADLSSPGVFLSNFEPLNRQQVKAIMQDVIGYDAYTEPVKQLLTAFVNSDSPEYAVCSSEPRVVDGKPSKNPRYLQNRPDLMNPEASYLAEVGIRLFRRIPMDQPVYTPVDAVLPGRRNNPADRKQNIPPLAVYNPVHYQELPELFMDFICSLTGKSPSTTGFGSEGALTKGPFNALQPSADLNNALLAYVLTGYHGFSSAAGYVGPKYRVEHDISLLIPEIWCRMQPHERDPKYLIKNGYLEKLNDFEYQGRPIAASRLGYRITLKFVHAFCGRIFNNPNAVFTEAMLKPELQDQEVYAEGIESIVVTQKRVAEQYFSDGSIDAVCPPLQALLHIMARGNYEGKDINHPDIRKLFTAEYVLNSDWYRNRLELKQQRETALWKAHIAYLKAFSEAQAGSEVLERLNIKQRLETAEATLKEVASKAYLKELHGTIGADPLTA